MNEKKLIIIAPGDDEIEKGDIISESDSFIARYPVSEILTEKVAGKETTIKAYADERQLPCREFEADWKTDRYHAKKELYKRMLEEGDILLLFSSGIRADEELIAEAKIQQFHGKIVKVRNALSLSEFTNAFLYANLVYYPKKELSLVYTGLLSFAYKMGYYLSFPYKDTFVNDEIFHAVSIIKNEPKEIQQAFLSEIGIPKLFAAKKQVLE